jgi:hypothetical protein
MKLPTLEADKDKIMSKEQNLEDKDKALHIGVVTNCADDYGTDECCTCDKHHYDEHTCPFAEEINDDSETLCNCCPYCEYQCAMDI